MTNTEPDMERAIRLCALALVLVVSAGSAARAAAPRDPNVDPRIWLEPCAARAWDRYEQWRDSLRRVLRLDSEPPGAHLVASIVTKPAFEPEWAVQIFRGDDPRCELRLAISKYSLSQAAGDGTCDGKPCPRKMGARFVVVPVSCGTVDAVREAAFVLLARMRSPRPDDPIILDGDSCDVTLAGVEGAESCGYTHAPPPGSPASLFGALASVLREVAEARGEQRARLESVASALACDTRALVTARAAP